MTTPIGAAMAGGYMDGRGIESPGLEAQSERWNALAQAAGTQPHSVLSQLAPSPIASNLSAPSQRDRLFPNGFVLGNNSNGSSAPTTETENYLKMNGQAE